MSEFTDQAQRRSDGTALAQAEDELQRVNKRVEAMRLVLSRLLQDVVHAESFLDQDQSIQLLEANEQLVIAALSAQSEAQTSAQALDEAQRVAGLDPLTNLPNRALFLDRLGHTLAHAKRYGTRTAVLFVDLDEFKQINDQLGHSVGDQALQRAASCLLMAVRESDTVSRLGGDEFLILLDELGHADDALLIANKIVAALAIPVVVDGHPLRLSASIGISIYPTDGDTAAGLIAVADEAMYRAKRRKAGSVGFNAGASLGRGGESGAGNTQRALVQRLETQQQCLARSELNLLEQEQRNAYLQEANEQLLLSALAAQDLLAVTEQAHQQQRESLSALHDELSDPRSPIRLAMSLLGRRPIDAPLPLPLPFPLPAQAIIELVRRLVEAHGGSVGASSAGRDQGSQFTVTLPHLG